MDSLQELTNAVNTDKEPAEICHTQEIYSGGGGGGNAHPLLTTAECPNRLTSLCRPGLGRTVHLSHAEEISANIFKYTFKQMKCDS